MENRLKKLFDFQRFEENPRLAAMIAAAENVEERELSEDELFGVNAAGEHGAPVKPADFKS